MFRAATADDLAASRRKLVSQAQAGVKDVGTMREYLRLVRDLRIEDAEGVCEYGTYVLAKGKGRLPSTECARCLQCLCSHGQQALTPAFAPVWPQNVVTWRHPIAMQARCIASSCCA